MNTHIYTYIYMYMIDIYYTQVYLESKVNRTQCVMESCGHTKAKISADKE